MKKSLGPSIRYVEDAYFLPPGLTRLSVFVGFGLHEIVLEANAVPLPPLRLVDQPSFPCRPA